MNQNVEVEEKAAVAQATKYMAKKSQFHSRQVQYIFLVSGKSSGAHSFSSQRNPMHHLPRAIEA
jgi:hypothetical protein